MWSRDIIYYSIIFSISWDSLYVPIILHPNFFGHRPVIFVKFLLGPLLCKKHILYKVLILILDKWINKIIEYLTQWNAHFMLYVRGARIFVKLCQRSFFIFFLNFLGTGIFFSAKGFLAADLSFGKADIDSRDFSLIFTLYFSSFNNIFLFITSWW